MVMDTSVRPSVRLRDLELKHLIALDAVATEGTFGKAVLGHARDIITRVEATGEAVERFIAGTVGRIDIGTLQSVSNVLLPAMVRQLRAEHPEVDIRLFEEEDNDAGAQGVLAGDLDIAFTIGHRGGDLESMLLLDDPFVLVAPKGELPDGRYPSSLLDQA